MKVTMSGIITSEEGHVELDREVVMLELGFQIEIKIFLRF